MTISATALAVGIFLLVCDVAFLIATTWAGETNRHHVARICYTLSSFTSLAFAVAFIAK